MSHAEESATEQLVTQYCRIAHLGDVQTVIVRRHLCDGLTPPELRGTLEEKAGQRPLRIRQIRELLDGGLRRICSLAGAREMLCQVVTPDQFARVAATEERPATTGELMSGPKRPEPGRRFYGEERIEMCFLPGRDRFRREHVPVRLVEEIRRPW